MYSFFLDCFNFLEEIVLIKLLVPYANQKYLVQVFNFPDKTKVFPAGGRAVAKKIRDKYFELYDITNQTSLETIVVN
jgi:hypothetical protein